MCVSQCCRDVALVILLMFIFVVWCFPSLIHPASLSSGKTASNNHNRWFEKDGMYVETVAKVLVACPTSGTGKDVQNPRRAVVCQAVSALYCSGQKRTRSILYGKSYPSRCMDVRICTVPFASSTLYRHKSASQGTWSCARGGQLVEDSVSARDLPLCDLESRGWSTTTSR